MLYHTTYLNSNEKAQWVVFIHGAGGSSTVWYKQLKSFKQEFNLLLIDLRGHGKTEVIEKINSELEYSFQSISEEIIEVINFLNIKRAHFIGVSLGTILIRQIINLKPSLVKSSILTGAILKLNNFSKTLIYIGNLTKSFIPFLLLYKIFAYVIMPRKNHRKSRNIFIKEANKIKKSEFLRWFKLTKKLEKQLKKFEKEAHNLPVLYLMGRQDHLFLKEVQKNITIEKNAQLTIVENCGHIVNIEKSDIFNTLSLQFLNDNK